MTLRRTTLALLAVLPLALGSACVEKVEASPSAGVPLDAVADLALSQVMTNEVLVLTTATLVGGTLSSRRSIYVQNLNSLLPIFCGGPVAAKAVLNKSVRLDPWQGIDFPLTQRQPIFCIASANQTTGGGTVYWEFP